MKSKGVISMIEETTPDFTEKTFKDAVPEYSFSGNGTQISTYNFILLRPLYKNYAGFCKKSRAHLWFFAIFSCEFSLYSLGYDYKTPVIGMIVAGGQRKQLVPIFHGGAGIIDRRYFDPSDILFKNLPGSQVVI